MSYEFQKIHASPNRMRKIATAPVGRDTGAARQGSRNLTTKPPTIPKTLQRPCPTSSRNH